MSDDHLCSCECRVSVLGCGEKKGGKLYVRGKANGAGEGAVMDTESQGRAITVDEEAGGTICDMERVLCKNKLDDRSSELSCVEAEPIGGGV